MVSPVVHLLIIDPQNDFCDLPPSHRPADPLGRGASTLAPSLPVPGAHQDMLRLAKVMALGGDQLSAITVTLDCHQNLDIAHPGFWAHSDGSPLAPFTQVGAQQVRSGELKPRIPAAGQRVLAYLEALEQAGRYQHMVWPVHCQVGTWGQNVHADLQAALEAWEAQTLQNVAWVLKGMNPWTEHFSAVMAEVPDPSDPSTQMNSPLLDALRRADRILIAGEAGSHCVKATTEHIVEQIGREHLSKLTLLEDCMSPVQGFEAQQAAFLDAMRAKGLSVLGSLEVLEAMQINANS